MKYLLLLLFSVFAILYVRIQAHELGKATYVEGCLDASLKLSMLGYQEESDKRQKFCIARKQMLDENTNVFQ